MTKVKIYASHLHVLLYLLQQLTFHIYFALMKDWFSVISKKSRHVMCSYNHSLIYLNHKIHYDSREKLSIYMGIILICNQYVKVKACTSSKLWYILYNGTYMCCNYFMILLWISPSTKSNNAFFVLQVYHSTKQKRELFAQKVQRLNQLQFLHQKAKKVIRYVDLSR